MLRDTRATEKPRSPKIAAALKQVQAARQAVALEQERAMRVARRHGKVLGKRVAKITTERVVRHLDLTVRNGIGKYRVITKRSA